MQQVVEKHVPVGKRARACGDDVITERELPGLAATGDGNYLLTPKPDQIAPLMQGLPVKQSQLGVAQLHKVVLDKILGLDQDTITKLGNVHYIRDAQEAAGLVESGEADIAFLIKPITL